MKSYDIKMLLGSLPFLVIQNHLYSAPESLPNLCRIQVIYSASKPHNKNKRMACTQQSDHSDATERACKASVSNSSLGGSVH